MSEVIAFPRKSNDREPLKLELLSLDPEQRNRLVLTFNRPPTPKELEFLNDSIAQATSYAALTELKEEGEP